MIKRALSDNGCPVSIINELMENAHERRWPPGLSTLETRQINRNHYVNFVCKRVPNKQAVLVIEIIRKFSVNSCFFSSKTNPNFYFKSLSRIKILYNVVLSNCCV